MDWSSTLAWVVSLSALMFFGSIVLAWYMIVRLPADYLVNADERSRKFAAQHPLVRVITIVTRNICGVLLLTAGVVMLLTPGQGILFIVLGVSLVDFPGKRDIVRRMMQQKRVFAAINRIREQANRPPLETAPSSAEVATENPR